MPRDKGAASTRPGLDLSDARLEERRADDHSLPSPLPAAPDPASAGPVPPGYKMTELGPLPQEWQVVRLGVVVSLFGSPVNPRQVVAERYVGLEHIESGDIRIRRWGHSQDVRSLKTAFQPGDVLYGKLRPYLDKAALAEWEGICSTDILVLRPGESLFPEFFAYLVHTNTFLKYAIATMTGVNHPRTSWNALQKMRVPLPPLPEQRAIAHVLRTVQGAKEATERVIAALRELKKSLMRHLFTCGPVPLDAAGNVELRETEIGPIPAHWQVVRLGEVVQETEQTDPRKDPEWQFRYIDVSCISNESLKIVGYQNIYGKDAPSRARKQVKAGDIIFATVRPYLKRIAIVPSELDNQICSTAFCVLRPKPEVVNGTYLFFAVSRAQFVTSIVEHQRGSSYPAVTDSDVLRGLIPLPPLPEQRAIAETLRAVDRKIEAEESRRQALEALFKALLHDLMTARRRLPPDFVARFVPPEPPSPQNPQEDAR